MRGQGIVLIGKSLASCLALTLLTVVLVKPSHGEPLASPNSSTQTTLAPNGRDLQVSGGDRAGGNLFHSFEDFSISENRSVIFAPPTDVRNIINRVLGDRVSTINGTITVVESDASVFLINPNGIVFGENAQLNVGSSFVATTAEDILFADGSAFGVSKLGKSPLLSVTMPVGLQFGANPGDIQNRSQFALPPPPGGPPFPIPIGLSVLPRSTLALVGGNVSVEGSPPPPMSPFPPSFATLSAPGRGRIEIGSVAGNERVSLAEVEEGWQFGYEDVAAFRDISLSFATLVTTDTVVLQGKQIALNNISRVTTENLGSEDIGGLKLVASDWVAIENGSSLISRTLAAGDAGAVVIQSDRVQLVEFGNIDSSSAGDGRGGDVTIQTQSLNIDGGTFGRSRISTQGLANGRAGDVFIETETLELSNGGVIVSSASPDFFIPRDDAVESGGGDIVIVATDSVDIVGQSLLKNPDEPTTVELLPNNNGGLFSETEDESRGNGGNIVVRTGHLNVVNGAEISVVAEAGSLGRAGNIVIETEGNLLMEGEGTGITAISFNAESAGNVNVDSRHVFVQDRANISVANEGLGEGGTLAVVAESLTVADEGQLSATTTSGNGGDISIELDNTLALRRGGTVTTSAGAFGTAGNGGNIDIDVGFVTAVPDENSDITANAFEGRGGNIAVNADGVFGIEPRDAQTDLSDITASSQTNVSGTITINAPEIDTDRSVVEEPNATAPPEVTRGCQAGRIQTASSFVDVGRGGLPIAPDRSHTRAAVWEDLRPVAPAVATALASDVVSNVTLSTPRPAIVEAQGWLVNAAGDIELVAQAPNPIAVTSAFRDRDCQGLTPHS